MARIPDDEIQRLKQEVSLERLVTASGVELRRHGTNLLGRCPWHDDQGPSLVITPTKNLWHCLGACQQGGSVIDWVMKARGVSFRHAVEILRGEIPLASRSRRAGPSPVEPSADDREILAQVVAYYHEALKQSPEALAYLESRGLRSPEAIERFRLGFANRTLGYRLPSKAARERLQQLGLIRDSGHEHFNGSLVVPLFGEQGEVLGMYGRKITPESKLRKGTPLHLYLPGPHRGLFNLEGLRSSKTVILCEALLDALTFWCAGFRNVAASYGVEGFTQDHLAAFQRHGTERVLIAYDRDDAGERAAQALTEKLMAAGLECFRIQFPNGMDANEYACKVQPPAKSLGVLVRHAVWLGKGQAPSRPLDQDLVAEALATAPADPQAAATEPTPEPAAAVPVPAPAAPADAPSLSLAAIAAKEETSPTPIEARPDELLLTFGDRRYRVRGLEKNLSHGQLRVNLLVCQGEALHVDTLDLYSARQRTAFLKQAAAELGTAEDTLRREVGRLLLKLEEAQDERIQEALKPKTQEAVLSDEERTEALALLQDPNLLNRILQDFAACGVVGEETNKLLGYLAAVSRKLEEPLAVIIQSSSAAGKSSLMEAVLAFVPEEDRVKYSAMTGQSLFYMGESDLQHKVLAIVEEQGAERAAYALKLLQSEGELTIASTGKDPQTGRLVTQEYRVQGPVMIFLTTTAVEVDEELLNRCLVLTVDEDREQTRAIHRLQRERQTLEGLLARQARPAVLRVHQNAQRLLKPLLVANPYARHLTFLDDRTRTRRDHVKYLTLIRTLALLHQYQRPVKTAHHRGQLVPYIEVTLDDIALANRLAHQVLGRSLDELAPQTRRLLLALDALVAEAAQAQGVRRSEVRFTRREVRERTGWSNTQVHIHLGRLVELEYLLVHRGGGSGQRFVYELLYAGQGEDGKPFLAGLIDVEALRAKAYDGDLSGSEAHLSGAFPAPFGPLSLGLPGESGTVSPARAAAESSLAARAAEEAHLEVRAMPSRRSRSNGNGAVAVLERR
jgi:DNA primase